MPLADPVMIETLPFNRMIFSPDMSNGCVRGLVAGGRHIGGHSAARPQATSAATAFVSQ